MTCLHRTFGDAVDGRREKIVVKHVVSNLARYFGYEVLGAWRVERLTQAKKLRNVFDALQINTVIDVGANAGQFHDFLRIEVGFSGQIHSIEPIPALATQMRNRQSSDCGWFVHEIALGPEFGERDFNVMAASTFSSFLEPRHDVADQFQTANRVIRKERVQMKPLDELTKDIGSDLRRTFLKMDTQGFDLEVVKGGDRTLREIPALQSEVSVRPIYAGMPDLKTSLAMFNALGFELSDMFLVSEDSMLRAIEFDCLMVRSKAA